MVDTTVPPESASIFTRMGLRRVINCSGAATWTGGSLMSPETAAALVEASRSFVLVEELNARVGEKIAVVTGAEAGTVTCGAFAGMVMATAACMTGTDPAAIRQLPDTTGLKNELIIHRVHRLPYDQAYRVAGAKIIEIGDASGTAAWELERAITERSAAVAYHFNPNNGPGALDFATVVSIAHAHDLPVIVDAAPSLPPVDHLRRWIRDGADLVIYSGGKGIRGPQNTALLAGRADLIAAARLNGPPHPALGRGMKVSKEAMAALWVALDEFLTHDHDADYRAHLAQAEAIAAFFAARSDSRYELNGDWSEWPAPTLLAYPVDNAWRPADIAAALVAGDPIIALAPWRGALRISTHGLQRGEEEIVIARLREVLPPMRDSGPERAPIPSEEAPLIPRPAPAAVRPLYEQIGVHPLINAAGPVTIVGGAVLRPETTAAMVEASRSFVLIEELNARVGEKIAAVTGAEAGYVIAGANAAMTIAAAACITGLDPVNVRQLPDTTGMRHELIIHRPHRIDYDQAYRVAGAKLVEIGMHYTTHAWELERAIIERTAGVIWHDSPNVGRGALDFETYVAIAHAHDLPVIVDAASTLPPVDHLRRWIERGADLVIYSGGKGIRGPADSGLLAGRADLIAAARLNGSPNASIGRGMKVSKEAMAGLWVALDLFLAHDHEADHRLHRAQAEAVAASVAGRPDCRYELNVEPEEWPAPVVRIWPVGGTWQPRAIDAMLLAGDPPVKLVAEYGGLLIHTFDLQPGEETILIDRLRTALPPL